MIEADAKIDDMSMSDFGAPLSPISVTEDGPGSTPKTPAVSLTDPIQPQPKPKETTRPPDTVSSLDSLSPKHRAFVTAYASLDSPTCGNGTRSALYAKIGNGNTSYAAVSASDLLKSPKIRNAISDILERYGIGREVRASYLADIARQCTSEIVHYNADGKVTMRQVVDNAPNRLKAIQMASKLAGDYDSARAAVHAQERAIAPIIAQWTKRIKAGLARADTDSPVDTSRDAVDTVGLTAASVDATDSPVTPVDTPPDAAVGPTDDAGTDASQSVGSGDGCTDGAAVDVVGNATPESRGTERGVGGG